jgi:hypothetical protein
MGVNGKTLNEGSVMPDIPDFELRTRVGRERHDVGDRDAWREMRREVRGRRDRMLRGTRSLLMGPLETVH